MNIQRTGQFVLTKPLKVASLNLPRLNPEEEAPELGALPQGILPAGTSVNVTETTHGTVFFHAQGDLRVIWQVNESAFMDAVS